MFIDLKLIPEASTSHNYISNKDYFLNPSRFIVFGYQGKQLSDTLGDCDKTPCLGVDKDPISLASGKDGAVRPSYKFVPP